MNRLIKLFLVLVTTVNLNINIISAQQIEAENELVNTFALEYPDPDKGEN